MLPQTQVSSCPICGLALSTIPEAVYHCVEAHSLPSIPSLNESFEWKPFIPNWSPIKTCKNERKIPDPTKNIVWPQKIPKCPFCPHKSAFQDKIDLPRHLLVEHFDQLNQLQSITCLCGEIISSESQSIRNHISSDKHQKFLEKTAKEIDVWPRKCGICKEQFSGLIDHLEHMKIHHPFDNKNKPRRVLCLCGARVKVAGVKNTINHLLSEQHLRFCLSDQSSQSDIECPHCDKTFKELLPAFLHWRDEHDHKNFKESLSCPCGSKMQLNASVNFILEHERGNKHLEWLESLEDNRLKPLEPF